MRYLKFFSSFHVISNPYVQKNPALWFWAIGRDFFITYFVIIQFWVGYYPQCLEITRRFVAVFGATNIYAQRNFV